MSVSMSVCDCVCDRACVTGCAGRVVFLSACLQFPRERRVRGGHCKALGHLRCRCANGDMSAATGVAQCRHSFCS